MALVEVHAQGLDELMAGIKGAATGLAREQRKEHKAVAVQVAAWAQGAARTGTRQQQAAAQGILGRATQKTARLRLTPFAQAAFLGMKRHSGWYAAPRYANSTGMQTPPWVGQNWTPGMAGQGPYVINPMLADRVDEIEAMYADAYERALKGAFPGGFE